MTGRARAFRRLRAMDLHVDDDGFVRAPVAACYPVLTHVAAWPSWWSGTRVEDGPGDDHHRISVGRGPHRLVLAARAHGWRHDAGFRLAVAGSARGEVEFWFEEGWDGVVVHHLATLRGLRAGQARRYRRWVRAGLWGLKDRVQADVLATGPA